MLVLMGPYGALLMLMGPSRITRTTHQEAHCARLTPEHRPNAEPAARAPRAPRRRAQHRHQHRALCTESDMHCALRLPSSTSSTVSSPHTATTHRPHTPPPWSLQRLAAAQSTPHPNRGSANARAVLECQSGLASLSSYYYNYKPLSSQYPHR
jgi:hypothetical protein